MTKGIKHKAEHLNIWLLTSIGHRKKMSHFVSWLFNALYSLYAEVHGIKGAGILVLNPKVYLSPA